MASNPRIDRLLPGLFQGPFVEDERAAEILRQLKARGRIDDIGAIATHWERFTPFSQMRFAWFMSLAQQAHLWNDPENVLGALPGWKGRAMAALEELAAAVPAERLPFSLQHEGQIRRLRKNTPEIAFLTAYAKFLHAEARYRRGVAGKGGILRIALALKDAADLAEKLPTRHYADVRQSWEFRLPLYQRARAYYLDGAGEAGVSPQRRGQFLHALKMLELRCTAALQIGEASLSPKKGRGDGSGGEGGDGSLPPFGLSGPSGVGSNGMSAAAVPGRPGVQALLCSGAFFAAALPAAAIRIR